MIKRILISFALLITGLTHADWATDRAGETGYVTVTALASVIDEAVPFCVVYLSDLPAGFHTAMSDASDTDGKTIRVSTSDGSTQLACVPLGVNTGTDTGCLIFLGTGMSASVDVSYRIYVGNAALSMLSASGGMGEQAVFADYAGVYFPGMATRDFTSGGRTLTANGTPTTAASGYEGITAADYDNASFQYHGYTGGMGLTAWPVAIETLFSSDLNSSKYPIGLGNSSTNESLALQHDTSIYNIIRGPSNSLEFPGTSSISTGTWYYAAGGRNQAASGVSWVQKGSDSRVNASTSTFSEPTFNGLAIGARYASGSAGSYFNGRVAFAAISSSVRSANFIATQHQNWLGNLYSTGSWTPNYSTATTVQADAIYNRSIRKSSGLLYKAAYLKLNLPSMSGNVVADATIQYNATTNAGPMNGISIYAIASSTAGAWDETSTFTTLDALSMGTAISTSNTLTASTGAKTLNIFGDATKGISKFYTDNPGGGSVTVALVWSGYSGTLNGTTTSLEIGDDGSTTPLAIFSDRTDATNYPRVTITYTAGAATVYPLLLVPTEE